MSTAFIDQRHPEYIANVGNWSDYEASHRADLAFAQGALIQHAREHADEFAGRKKRAYPLALAAQVVDARSAYLFRKPPTINWGGNSPLGDDWDDDVDLMGSDFARFTQHVAKLSMIDGHVWVGVDSPRIESTGPRTRLDDMTDGIRPYLTCYRPADVVNWGVDRFGQLDFALVKQAPGGATVTMTGGHPSVSGTDAATYILWTRNEWARLDDKGGVIETAPHPLGVVPLVPIRFEKSPTGEFIGLSLLRTIAPKIKNIINKISLVDEIHHTIAYPILVVDVESMQAILSMSGSSVVTGDGPRPSVQIAGKPGKIFVYAGDTPPQFIAPDMSSATSIMDAINFAIADVYGDAKLAGRYQPEASGLSKQWDFHETNQSLRAQAANLSDGLEEVLYIAGKWVGAKIENVRVQFADDYGVESGADVIQRFGQAMLADPDLPPQIIAAYREKIVRTEFGDATGDAVDAMLKQIRAESVVDSGPPKPLAVVGDGME